LKQFKPLPKILLLECLSMQRIVTICWILHSLFLHTKTATAFNAS